MLVKTMNQRSEVLRKFIALAIASAYVKNERSVSVLILAKPESGKTFMMSRFAINNGIVFASDLTYSGLVDLLGRIKAGDIKTILIPDMLKLVGRKESTVVNLITFLNELIEEGVKTIHTYRTTVDFGEFVRCNIVSAITSTDFFATRLDLGRTGFLSRVVPFSYAYSYEDVQEIFREIMEGQNFIEYEYLKLRTREVELPFELAKRIKENITDKAIERINRSGGLELYGFRLQRNLQVLAKANALLRKDKIVREEDVAELERMCEWFNFEFNILR